MEKNKNPLLGLWNSRGKQLIIAADFDNLPSQFKSFAELKEYMEHHYPAGLTISTYSNKIKTLFSFEIIGIDNPGGLCWKNYEIAKGLLEQVVEPDLYKVLDTSKSALSSMYLSKDITAKMSDGLSTLEPYTVEYPSLSTTHSDTSIFINSNQQTIINSIGNTGNKVNHLYITYDGLLPGEIRDYCRSVSRYKKTRDNMDKLMRILITMNGLLDRRGFDLPLSVIANTIKVEKMTAKRLRDRLVKDGWLHLRSRSVITVEDGRQKRYGDCFKASKRLIPYIRDVLSKQPPKRLIIVDTPPTTFKDGEWRRGLLKQAHKFYPRKTDYFEWIDTLEGIDGKIDRRRNAEMAWDSVVEWRHENKSVPQEEIIERLSIVRGIE